MTMINEQRLQNRVMGRDSAKAAVDLILEACSDAGLDDDAKLAFWDQIKDELEDRGVSLLDATTKGVAAPTPMGDAETAYFRESPVPYGKHQGKAVKDVLQWLDWLIGQRDEFKDKVKRYMARSDVQEALQQELQDDSG